MAEENNKKKKKKKKRPRRGSADPTMALAPGAFDTSKMLSRPSRTTPTTGSQGQPIGIGGGTTRMPGMGPATPAEIGVPRKGTSYPGLAEQIAPGLSAPVIDRSGMGVSSQAFGPIDRNDPIAMAEAMRGPQGMGWACALVVLMVIAGV
jgi:hypothetical protein